MFQLPPRLIRIVPVDVPLNHIIPEATSLRYHGTPHNGLEMNSQPVFTPQFFREIPVVLPDILNKTFPAFLLQIYAAGFDQKPQKGDALFRSVFINRLQVQEEITADKGQVKVGKILAGQIADGESPCREQCYRNR